MYTETLSTDRLSQALRWANKIYDIGESLDQMVEFAKAEAEMDMHTTAHVLILEWAYSQDELDCHYAQMFKVDNDAILHEHNDLILDL